MKKVWLLTALLLWQGVSSCSIRQPEPLSDSLLRNIPFGQYKLVGYENQPPVNFDITLEIKDEPDQNQHHVVNGRGCINFYFASCQIELQNRQIRFSNIASTEIKGEQAKLNFEKEYLKRLSEVKYFEMSASGDRVTFFLDDAGSRYLTFLPDSGN